MASSDASSDSKLMTVVRKKKMKMNEENEQKSDPDDLSSPRPCPKPGPGDPPLQFNYAFWYSPPISGYSPPELVKTFASVEKFWAFYSNILRRPSDLPIRCDYHLFKEGIRPMWEDSANQVGGKWIIRLEKGLASCYWENLILAMVGEQFMMGEEICGAVIAIRYEGDNLSLWNRTANDPTTIYRIRDTLKRVLNLPPNTNMAYKPHY